MQLPLIEKGVSLWQGRKRRWVRHRRETQRGLAFLGRKKKPKTDRRRREKRGEADGVEGGKKRRKEEEGEQTSGKDYREIFF